MGTPKKYKPEYADELPEMFSEGQDVLEVASQLGVNRACFYQWIDKYPDFAEAYERGKEKSHAWWHTQARKAVSDPEHKVNGSVLIFGLKNKLGWRDKQEIDHTSTDGSMTPKVVERRIIKPDDNE